MASRLTPHDKRVNIGSTQDILLEAIPVEDEAAGRILLVAQDRSQYLEDGRDTTAGADHDESLDEARLAADFTITTTFVLELADWAFEIDKVAHRNGVKGFGHLAANALFGVIVDFYEDVENSPLCMLGDGCVGSDDCFSGYRITQTHH